MDVLAVTYQDLSQAPGKSPPWVTTGEVIALLEAFCIDCPDEHVMLFRDAFKVSSARRNELQLWWRDWAYGSPRSQRCFWPRHAHALSVKAKN